MIKKLRDVTFEEFDEWANHRACDGKWSLSDAIQCAEAIRMVLDVKPLFGRKRKREQEWERIKQEYFNLNAEINV